MIRSSPLPGESTTSTRRTPEDTARPTLDHGAVDQVHHDKMSDPRDAIEERRQAASDR